MFKYLVSASLSLFIFYFCISSSFNTDNFLTPQKHVLFIIGGGSHIHPTVEIVKQLSDKKVKITYLSFDTSSKDLIKIKSFGANVLSLSKELHAINHNFTIEQHTILKNPSDNFVDQPQGAQDTAILSQYFMALFWDELLLMVQKINPDVMIIDSTQTSWGKYMGKMLNIPTFVSFPSAFYYNEWKDPQFPEYIKMHYAQSLPPTPKRLWAVSYLQKKLGTISADIDVNFPAAFSDPEYATFIYSYPQFIGYNGERFLNTNLVFAGYPDEEDYSLTQSQQNIIQSITEFKKNKKLVFISMGTDSSKSLEFFTMLGQALGNNTDNTINNDIVVALHPGYKDSKDNIRYNTQDISLHMKQLGHTNFIVFDYFPLPHLFTIIDVFIGHGGHNSSMQALKHSIPMILLPIHSDQIIVGNKFQELDFAQTIPYHINPMKCTNNFTAWKNFYDDTLNRTQFIEWIQQSTYKALSEINTETKRSARKNAINALLQTDQGYGHIVKLILSTNKP